MKVSGDIKLSAYAVISRAVEEGIPYGINRAYKHVDNPTREHLAAEIHIAVMAALDEVIDFEVDA